MSVHTRPAPLADGAPQAARPSSWRSIAAVCSAGAWRRLGRPGRALAAYDRCLQRRPGDPRALLGRAELRARAGDRSGAIDDYHALVRIEPQRAGAWLALGRLLEQGEQWHGAAQCFGRAAALVPALEPAWYELGLVLLRLHRVDEAIAALRRIKSLQTPRR